MCRFAETRHYVRWPELNGIALMRQSPHEQILSSFADCEFIL